MTNSSSLRHISRGVGSSSPRVAPPHHSLFGAALVPSPPEESPLLPPPPPPPSSLSLLRGVLRCRGGTCCIGGNGGGGGGGIGKSSGGRSDIILLIRSANPSLAASSSSPPTPGGISRNAPRRGSIRCARNRNAALHAGHTLAPSWWWLCDPSPPPPPAAAAGGGVGSGWRENWTDMWAAQRGQLASARIRPPPPPEQHLRTAAAVSGAAASRSFEKVRNMAMRWGEEESPMRWWKLRERDEGDRGGRRRRSGKWAKWLYTKPEAQVWCAIWLGRSPPSDAVTWTPSPTLVLSLTVLRPGAVNGRRWMGRLTCGPPVWGATLSAMWATWGPPPGHSPPDAEDGKKKKRKKENLIFFPDGLRKRDGMARSAHLLKSMIFACFESSRSKFR